MRDLQLEKKKEKEIQEKMDQSRITSITPLVKDQLKCHLVDRLTSSNGIYRQT